MKRARLTLGVLVVASLVLAGCSNQWRRADLGMSFGEVNAVLDSVQSEIQTQSVGGDSTHFFNLRDTSGMSLYFADGPSPLGPVISIMSLATFDFLGSEMANLFYDDIVSVRVAFIEVPGASCALMVDSKLTSGSYNTQFFSCNQPPYVDGGEYVAVLDGGSGQIALRSNDVDKDGVLKGVIQMRISVVDSAGNDTQIGKFSTLVGFGP